MPDTFVVLRAPDTGSPRVPIALCCIVRDAARTIDALLDAVVKSPRYLAEYCFVDTGSADDTRERIATRFAVLGDWSRPPQWGNEPGSPCRFCDGGVALGRYPCGECGASGTTPDTALVFRHAAAGIRLTLARFKWVDDFAAARNFAFSLAEAPWIAWLDADDVPDEADTWETTLAAQVAQYPDANCVRMDYDYAPGTLEKLRVRFVRREAGWRWRGVGAARGRVHEQLRRIEGPEKVIPCTTPPGAPPGTSALFTVHHRPPLERTNADTEARNRPLELMELAACEEAGDRAGASVQHLYLARGFDAAGDSPRAEHHLRQAVAKSNGGHVGVMALLHFARTAMYDALGEKPERWLDALRYAGESFALMREPQSAAVVAVAAAARQRWQDTVAWYGTALGMPITAIGLFWDPLLMDGLQHAAGAEAMLAAGNLGEATAALARITPDARRLSVTAERYAALEARLRSSIEVGPGEKRLTILAPAIVPFDAESPQHGHVGGSEEAVIHLSRALARCGCDVTVFARPVPGRPQRPDGGVLWRPYDEHNLALLPKGSAVLVWRIPQYSTDPAMAACRARKVLWLHDASYGVAPSVYAAWDRVVVLSDAHVKSLRERDKYDGPTARGANGIDPSEFPPPDEALRDPHRCVYASSPNRGLDHLLAVWPDVRAAVPDATLDVGYDWTIFERQYPAWAARLKARMAELPGVTFHGGLSHGALHDLLRRAGVLSYPATYWETWCVLSTKSQACGCWPVTTSVAGIAETTLTGDMIGGIDWTKWPGGEPPHEAVLWEEDGRVEPGKADRSDLHGLRDEFTARYRDALIRRLLDPPTAAERVAMREKALGRFSWDAAAEKFEAILFGLDPETSMSTGENDPHARLVNMDGDLAYCLDNNPIDGISAETIAELLAEIPGENDGPAWAWIVRLAGGRFAGICGDCDYTGWDCQSSAEGATFDTPADAAAWCADKRLSRGTPDDKAKDREALLRQLSGAEPVGGRMEHLTEAT